MRCWIMKNYVIIGASTGIGRALALELSGQGHLVTATFNQTTVSSTNTITYHKLDVLEDNQDYSFLPEQIDGLVYCPGSINLKPFARIKVDAFLEDFRLQVGGAIQVIQAAIPRLKQADDASILLFSTVAVQTGYNFHSQVAASKGAIEGLCRSLAAEFAPNIRVNCIAPSLTDTPLAGKLLNSDDKKASNSARHPMGRIGAPADLAHMASFLLSDKASWITGQIIHVDGGMSSINK